MYYRGMGGAETDEMICMFLFGRKSMSLKGFIYRLGVFAGSFIKPLLFWFFSSMLLQGPCPYVTVLSNSMYPTFKRGDVIIGKSHTLAKDITGSVVIYTLNSSFPMVVHRDQQIHIVNSTSKLILTKGDNSERTDEWLYNDDFLAYDQIDSMIIGVLPFIGYPYVFLREHPAILFLIIFYNFRYCFS